MLRRVGALLQQDDHQQLGNERGLTGLHGVASVGAPNLNRSEYPALEHPMRTNVKLTAGNRSTARLSDAMLMDDWSLSETMGGRVDLDRLPPDTSLWRTSTEAERNGAAIKRALDLTLSVLMLLILSPLFPIVALLIKLDSRGPVFYRPERVGLNGRVFTLFKFRSMRADAEAGGQPRWAARSDPRITRVGALLRNSRIDELPQLINVIRDEMSLVGPRPERPHFVAQLDQVIPHYSKRASVLPGITGWAQTNFPYGASIEDARQKLAYDLYYVKHQSLRLDLAILAATVRVVLTGRGAR
jgi:exopolysaccharide biosynthesis polyprenyl glycosylphosphotransferase